MGDRIAVMDTASSSRSARRRSSTRSPRNMFVAGFIGSPAMNLVPAPLVEAGTDAQVAGFRPEHVDLGNGRPDCVHCGAHIEVVEYLGDEQLVHLRVGSALVQAKLHAEHRVEYGRDVQISVPHDRVVLFDAESGERVTGS